MADLEKSVKIIFQGEDKELSLSMQKIAGNFDDLSGVANKIVRPLASAADSILKLDAAMALMAGGAIAMAIKAAGEFNGKFGEITTLISDTGAPIEKFKSDIKDYAVDSVKSIDDINQAIYTAVSAGVDYKDAIKFVNEAEMLSVAGRSSLGDTTKVLISVLNAYGASTDQAGKYSDIMFATVKGGLTTMTELSTTLSQVTGLAANAGIPFETLGAAIAALTTAGMPTAQAITSIKASIQNIIKPTAEAEAMAKSLGLQFDAGALKTKGYETVLWEAWKATKGNTTQMATLFGSIEALNGVLVLASDKTGKFKDSLQDTANSAGGVKTAYAKVAEELANVNQTIENAFKIALGEIGEKLMPAYKNLGASLSDIFKGIKIGVDSGAFDPLFAYLAQVGGELAEKMKIIAANLPEAMKGLDFSGLIKSLGSLGSSLEEAFKSVFGNIDLTTPEGLHEVLQKIINAFTKLTEVTKGIIDGMAPLFKTIGVGIDTVGGLDTKTTEFIGTLMGAAKGISVLADNAGILTGALGILASRAVIDAVSGIARLGTSAVSALPGITSFVGGLAGLGTVGAVGAAAGVGVVTGTLLNQVPVVQKAAQGILGLLDVNKDYFGALPGGAKNQEEINAKFETAQKKAKEMAEAKRDAAKATGELGEEAKKTTKDLNDIPEEKNILWQFEGADKIKQAIIDIGKEVVNTGNQIEEAFPEEERRIVIGYIEDENGRRELTQSVSEFLKDEKKIPVKLDSEEIKKDSKDIQTMIEWNAKLNIADVEAATNQMKMMFSSLDSGISSTGSILSSLFGTLSNATSSWNRTTIESAISSEVKLREEEFALQQKLINQQIEMNQLKIDRIKSGESLMKITAEGLEPELEAFMWKIIKKVQVRANEASAEFLLGMNTK